MKLPRILCALLALLLLPGCAAAPSRGEDPCTAEIFAMDTIMKLTVYGPRGREAVDLAAGRIRELEGLLSVTEEGSEIYAANHAGGAPAALSEEVSALLERALALCGSTGGALDLTIYPVLRCWGFTTDSFRVPEEGELAALLERVDYRRVSLEGNVLTLPEGMELDLGAVAKGYTGSRLAELLKGEGVTSAILELGGNVQALGARPDGSPWRVGIQSPEGSGYAGVLEVTDRAVVTSGGYQRFFEQDGQVYWHILDPADGYPARSGLASATVVAEDGLLCDALSTAFFVMGAEKAARYWRENGGFDFILLDEAGSITITEGLEESFSPYGSWAERPLEVIRP